MGATCIPQRALSPPNLAGPVLGEAPKGSGSHPGQAPDAGREEPHLQTGCRPQALMRYGGNRQPAQVPGDPLQTPSSGQNLEYLPPPGPRPFLCPPQHPTLTLIHSRTSQGSGSEPSALSQVPRPAVHGQQRGQDREMDPRVRTGHVGFRAQQRGKFKSGGKSFSCPESETVRVAGGNTGFPVVSFVWVRPL